MFYRQNETRYDESTLFIYCSYAGKCACYSRRVGYRIEISAPERGEDDKASRYDRESCDEDAMMPLRMPTPLLPACPIVRPSSKGWFEALRLFNGAALLGSRAHGMNRNGYRRLVLIALLALSILIRRVGHGCFRDSVQGNRILLVPLGRASSLRLFSRLCDELLSAPFIGHNAVGALPFEPRTPRIIQDFDRSVLASRDMAYIVRFLLLRGTLQPRYRVALRVGFVLYRLPGWR